MKVRTIAFGIVGFILFVILISGAYYAGIQAGSGTVKTVTAPPLTQTVTTTITQLTNTTTVTVTVTVAPSSPSSQAWHRVATFKGAATKTTDLFEIKGKQFRLTWSILGARTLSMFGFIVYPEGETIMYVGSPVMVSGSKQTSDTTYIYEGPGKFYIQVNSANIDSWQIVVEDYY